MLRRYFIGDEAVERENKLVDSYIEEVIALGKKYGLSLSHEDSGGAFLIKPFNEDDSEWLWCAIDESGTLQE